MSRDTTYLSTSQIRHSSGTAAKPYDNRAHLDNQTFGERALAAEKHKDYKDYKETNPKTTADHTRNGLTPDHNQDFINSNNQILSFSSQARSMISNELKNIRKDLELIK